MKKIFALISCSFLLFSCSNFLANNFQEVEVSEDFVQGSEDIPLLVGMEKISEDSVGFDSASGSIISSSYTAKLNQKKVRNFYLSTLPQMGWQIVKNTEKGTSFSRENENLEIEFMKDGDRDVVMFFISSSAL